ncbi:hypothetical protein [Chamaesiphon sp.]|uniref:hypothetical protein n=1 Tax=Chamaesiphon sp. TaxID=2814140 RepID=UPI003593CA87
MNTKIVCPVCDRAAIEVDTCPNCQTDLSLIRMLSELPLIVSTTPDFSWLKWSIGILLTAILVGWEIWVH